MGVLFMEFRTKNSSETKNLSRFLLKKIARIKATKALVVALEGELGAGKTTFVQGLAKEFGIKNRIKSPTFNLMKRYFITRSDLDFENFYHIDCYRLKDYKDLEILGIREILEDSRNIILIEWADRVKEILPKKCVKIHIDHIGKNERKISIK